jgi:hypothetical protein
MAQPQADLPLRRKLADDPPTAAGNAALSVRKLYARMYTQMFPACLSPRDVCQNCESRQENPEARRWLSNSVEQRASSGLSINLCGRVDETTFGSKHGRRGRRRRERAPRCASVFSKDD